jgi:hypothetical protein
MKESASQYIMALGNSISNLILHNHKPLNLRQQIWTFKLQHAIYAKFEYFINQ